MTPYQYQIESLDYRHSMETESAWNNNSDSDDTEAVADRMLSVGSGAHTLAKAQKWLQAWMGAMPVISFNFRR